MVLVYIGGGFLLAIVVTFAVITHNIINACEEQEGYEQEGGIKL